MMILAEVIEVVHPRQNPCRNDLDIDQALSLTRHSIASSTTVSQVVHPDSQPSV